MLYDPKWTPPATEIQLEAWQKVLLDAANVIEQHGWVQHKYGNEKVGFCTLGAIRTAMQIPLKSVYKMGSPHDEKSQVSEAIWDVYTDVCGKVREHVGISAGVWNDITGRTKEEVVSALRKAAHAV